MSMMILTAKFSLILTSKTKKPTTVILIIKFSTHVFD